MGGKTIDDLFALMQYGATKDDIETIKTKIDNINVATSQKIEEIKVQVESNQQQTQSNTDQIAWLQASIETLKQDKLSSNVCISGIPTELINNDNTAELVINIAKTLGVEFDRNNFSSYPVANKKFVIVHFYSIRSKQQIIGKIRVKKSLIAEEVFNGTSNSQIYLNDHLTPYFNKLYLMARNAKREGKLASASSYGGKIRARKSLDHAPVLINNEQQLQAIIDSDNINNSLQSQQHTDEMMNTSHSTSNHSTDPSISNASQKRINNKPYRSRTTLNIEKAKNKNKNKTGEPSNSQNTNNTNATNGQRPPKRSHEEKEEHQNNPKKPATGRRNSGNSSNTNETE